MKESEERYLQLYLDASDLPLPVKVWVKRIIGQMQEMQMGLSLQQSICFIECIYRDMPIYVARYEQDVANDIKIGVLTDVQKRELLEGNWLKDDGELDYNALSKSELKKQINRE